jgi:hypothetical protein
MVLKSFQPEAPLIRINLYESYLQTYNDYIKCLYYLAIPNKLLLISLNDTSWSNYPIKFSIFINSTLFDRAERKFHGTWRTVAPTLGNNSLGHRHIKETGNCVFPEISSISSKQLFPD